MLTVNNKTEKQSEREKSSVSQRVLTVIGIVLCVLLIPMLIVNCTLIVKSWINDDEIPDFAGVVPLIVLTDSMYPDIKSGDLIFVSSVDAGELRVGDVISFYAEEGDYEEIWTHKIIGIYEKDGKLEFETQGVNNPTPDSSRRSEDHLVGKYTGVRLAGIGNVAMFMQTVPGLIVCVAVPIVLFVGYDLIRRRRYEKDNATDVEALRAELEALRAAQAQSKQEPAAGVENAENGENDEKGSDDSEK